MARDPHALAGAYALDAISDPAESERFAKHLGRCRECAHEVSGLREVATAMAFGVEEFEPPASMRDTVLTAVSRTRQLPPLVKTVSRRRAAWLITWTPRLVAVAAAVVAIVLGIQLSNTQDRLGRAQAQDHGIAAVLAAPDARVVTGSVTGGGSTTAVVSASRHSLVITSTGLPALPGGKVYELWLIGPSVIRSAGLVPAAGGPVLASGLAPGDRLGMTVERAGGANQPTTRPIVLIPLS